MESAERAALQADLQLESEQVDPSGAPSAVRQEAERGERELMELPSRQKVCCSPTVRSQRFAMVMRSELLVQAEVRTLPILLL